MLLWLHGSAGIGKSAIAQMFAADCQTHRRHGASFFFRRGHSERGTWFGLFATIAYQLAHSVPEFSPPLQQALEADKLILGRNMATQFQKLLVEPFSQIQDLETLPVVVLDGLDECEDYKIHQQILRLFIKSIERHELPIRLLISSRPEAHIREILQCDEASVTCQGLELIADQAAYDGIRKYLRDEFNRVHVQNRSRGVDLGAVWPNPEVLEHLVRKSSGIFIYAATVIRFVEDEYSHPIDRLDAILTLDPKSCAPLDDLYTQILSAAGTPEDQQLRVLYGISNSGPLALMAAEEIDRFLRFRPGTCRLALRGLHSILHVPPISLTRHSGRGRIYPLHASLRDYLCDVRRSGKWCVSLPWLRSDYLHCLIRLLSSPPLTHNDRALHW